MFMVCIRKLHTGLVIVLICRKIARNERPVVLQVVNEGLWWSLPTPWTITKPQIIGDGDRRCRTPSVANPPVYDVVSLLRSNVDLL